MATQTCPSAPEPDHHRGYRSCCQPAQPVESNTTNETLYFRCEIKQHAFPIRCSQGSQNDSKRANESCDSTSKTRIRTSARLISAVVNSFFCCSSALLLGLESNAIVQHKPHHASGETRLTPKINQKRTVRIGDFKRDSLGSQARWELFHTNIIGHLRRWNQHFS
jgi:hypothetical protein